MSNNIERSATTAIAIAAAALLIITGTTVMGVVAGAVVIVSTIVERRSLAWALLVGALLLVAWPTAAIAAAMLVSPANERDLAYQGSSALRRCLGAVIHPALTIGAAIGAYRFGGRDKLLWWFIGWTPAALSAVMAIAFVHDLVWSPMLLVAVGAGIFLSLESAQSTFAAHDIPTEPMKDRPEAGGRTVVARRNGGPLDWTDVVPELTAQQARQARPQVVIPDDPRELDVPHQNGPNRGLSDDDGTTNYIQG